MGKKIVMFPEIAAQMARKGETQEDVAKILGLDKSQVSRKLAGHIDWSIGDVEILCKYYNMDFWELFKRKEFKDEILED